MLLEGEERLTMLLTVTWRNLTVIEFRLVIVNLGQSLLLRVNLAHSVPSRKMAPPRWMDQSPPEGIS